MRKAVPGFIGGILCLWLGMVVGISFLEAPLKFQAPGITVPLGLGIGRLVFHALNRIELVLAFLAITLAFWSRPAPSVRLGTGLVAAILLAQTFWLLPALDARAEVVLSGGTPEPSQLHILYIVLEIGKAFFLAVTASFQFLHNVKNHSKPNHGEYASLAQPEIAGEPRRY